MIVIFLNKNLNFLNIYVRFAFAACKEKASEPFSEALQTENYMYFDFALSDDFSGESLQVDFFAI